MLATDSKRDLLWLSAALLVFFGLCLGLSPYINPSEARLIEIPRQMLASGDWLTPHVNGVPYFEKPPLFYWVQASMLHVFGMSEWAGRLANCLMVIATVLLTHATGRMLYSRAAGLLAALVLSTCLMGYALSRFVTLDVPLTLMVTFSIFWFIRALKTFERTERRLWYGNMYVASGLAVMSKGMLGLVLPALIIGSWVLVCRRWDILSKARLGAGLLILLAITAPWHVLMAIEHPQFLNYYFVQEHFNRFVSDGHKRTMPWWFFIAVGAAGLLPWLCVLPSSLRRMWEKRNETAWLLMLWAGLPLLFFSGSHSKLAPYIFPSFPPLAVMMGVYLSQLWKKDNRNLSITVSGWVLVAVLGSAAFLLPVLDVLPGKAGRILKSGETLLPLLLPLAPATMVLLATLIMGKTSRSVIAAIAGLGVVLNLCMNFAVLQLNPTSTKPLAEALSRQLEANDLVATYDNYWHDLPVYLNRNVMVVNWLGDLEFGLSHHPPSQQWMLNPDNFLYVCANNPASLYVFGNSGDLEKLTSLPNCPLVELARSGPIVLLKKVPAD